MYLIMSNFVVVKDSSSRMQKQQAELLTTRQMTCNFLNTLEIAEDMTGFESILAILLVVEYSNIILGYAPRCRRTLMARAPIPGPRLGPPNPPWCIPGRRDLFVIPDPLCVIAALKGQGTARQTKSRSSST